MPGGLAFTDRLSTSVGTNATGLANAPPAPTGTVLTSDKGEARWDLSQPGKGLVTINTARTKALVGFADHRAVNLGGIIVTPGTTQLGWCVLGLTLTRGEVFTNDCAFLATATGWWENTGQIWSSASKDSVGNHWGQAPVLTEVVPFALTLPVGTNVVRAWSLDERGQRKSALPLTGDSASATLTVATNANSIWYEIQVQLIDSDGDGLPDAWELAHFRSATAASATADSDGDGLTNLQEYIAGTDPQNPDSFLRITEVSRSGNDVVVSFTAVAGRIYTLESKDSLTNTNAPWQNRLRLTNGLDAIVRLVDPGAAVALTNRFYHVVTGPNWEVISEPAGFYSLPLAAGANALSAPLHPLTAARGLVSSVNGNTVAVSGNPLWALNTYAPADGFSQYVFMVINDAAAPSGSPGIQGDWWTITGNTANSVTLNTGSDNLAGLLAPGDTFAIYRLASLKDLFGYGSSLSLNKDNNFTGANGDVIRFVYGTSFGTSIFYHDGSLAPAGYYLGNLGPLDGSTITLLPGQGFMLFCPANTALTNCLMSGGAHTKKVTLYLQPGANVIGLPFAGSAPVGTSNLKESGWTPDNNFSAAGGVTTADVLRPITGTSFGTPVFYHDGTLAPAGWYQGGNLNNQYLLQPGQAYIFLDHGANLKRWRQSVPY